MLQKGKDEDEVSSILDAFDSSVSFLEDRWLTLISVSHIGRVPSKVREAQQARRVDLQELFRESELLRPSSTRPRLTSFRSFTVFVPSSSLEWYRI